MTQQTAAELQKAISDVEARRRVVDPNCFAVFTIWPNRYTITIHPGRVTGRLEAEGKTPEEAFDMINSKIDEGDPALLAADFAGAPVYGA